MADLSTHLSAFSSVAQKAIGAVFPHFTLDKIAQRRSAKQFEADCKKECDDMIMMVKLRGIPSAVLSLKPEVDRKSVAWAECAFEHWLHPYADSYRRFNELQLVHAAASRADIYHPIRNHNLAHITATHSPEIFAFLALKGRIDPMNMDRNGTPCIIHFITSISGKLHPVQLKPPVKEMFTQALELLMDRSNLTLLDGRWKWNEVCLGNQDILDIIMPRVLARKEQHEISSAVLVNGTNHRPHKPSRI